MAWVCNDLIQVWDHVGVACGNTLQHAFGVERHVECECGISFKKAQLKIFVHAVLTALVRGPASPHLIAPRHSLAGVLRAIANADSSFMKHGILRTACAPGG